MRYKVVNSRFWKFEKDDETGYERKYRHTKSKPHSTRSSKYKKEGNYAFTKPKNKAISPSKSKVSKRKFKTNAMGTLKRMGKVWRGPTKTTYTKNVKRTYVRKHLTVKSGKRKK
jgi:hypothetical protein